MRRLLAPAAILLLVSAVLADKKPADKKPAPAPSTLEVGSPAPAFKIKGSDGKVLDLAELSAKGPVLVRLTCGCSGCDRELGYFKALHEAYKGAGLASVAVFKETDAKVEAYVKKNELNMLYAVDTKGESWKVFGTKTMPSNFLIGKGGKILAISVGCDPSGLIAKKISDKVAETVKAPAVDVRKK